MYQDGWGGWYLKVTLGRDPLSGRREQITKRWECPTLAPVTRQPGSRRCGGRRRTSPLIGAVEERSDPVDAIALIVALAVATLQPMCRCATKRRVGDPWCSMQPSPISGYQAPRTSPKAQATKSRTAGWRVTPTGLVLLESGVAVPGEPVNLGFLIPR